MKLYRYPSALALSLALLSLPAAAVKVADVEVAPTAQVAGQALLDLLDGGVRQPSEQVVGSHQLARDAEPALRRTVIEERLLKR